MVGVTKSALCRPSISDPCLALQVNRAMVELLVQRPDAPPDVLARDIARQAASPAVDVLDPGLARLLAESNLFAYDIFALAEATQGRPLAPLAFWALCQLGCVDSLGFDARRLMRFLTVVEDGYDAGLSYHW